MNYLTETERFALYRDLLGVLEATGVLVTEHMEDLVGLLVEAVDETPKDNLETAP